MGLKAEFHRAKQIIAKTDISHLRKTQEICKKIRAAEIRLMEKAAPLMEKCGKSCYGICCKNIELDAIIGLGDFIYILILAGHMEKEISECLEKENPLFRSDCIFLKNGKGPCIFPYAIRPEVCITTFCGDDSIVKKEIREVKKGFVRLGWYVTLTRIKRILNIFARVTSPGIFRSH